MPQADLSFSEDLEFDAGAALAAIETFVLARDPGAGECKGRAMRVSTYHHTHVFLQLRLLPKPHRTMAWQTSLAEDLRAELGRLITQPCAISVLVEDSLRAYATGPYGDVNA